MTVEQGAITYGQQTVAYTIKRSARKTLAIAVHPDGSVQVTAPRTASKAAIAERVRKRARWIGKQQRYFLQFQPRPELPHYVAGESHLYLGRRYQLKLRQAKREDVKLQRGTLLVTLPDRANSERVRDLLACWYMEKAKHIFAERLGKHWARFETDGSAPPRLQIRVMKTRWGSLSKSGLMTLNLTLVRAPKDCIDYVIVHELCHLKHHHHGPAFYRLLNRLLPDWETRKQRLEWLG